MGNYADRAVTLQKRTQNGPIFKAGGGQNGANRTERGESGSGFWRRKRQNGAVLEGQGRANGPKTTPKPPKRRFTLRVSGSYMRRGRGCLSIGAGTGGRAEGIPGWTGTAGGETGQAGQAATRAGGSIAVFMLVRGQKPR